MDSVNSQKSWLPSGYHSQLRIADWKNLLSDAQFFSIEQRQMMRRMLEIGGTATPQELAERFGECPSFYMEIADEIGYDASSLLKNQPNFDTKTYGFWPMWMEGQLLKECPDAPQRRNYCCRDIYRWRLRQEIRIALEEIDLSQIPLYSEHESDADRFMRLRECDEAQRAIQEEKQRQEAELKAQQEREKKDVERILTIVRYGTAIAGLCLAALQIWLRSRS